MFPAPLLTQFLKLPQGVPVTNAELDPSFSQGPFCPQLLCSLPGSQAYPRVALHPTRSLQVLSTCVHSSLSSLGLESKTSLQKDFWGTEGNYIVTTTIMKSGGGVNKMEWPLLPCEDGDHFLSSRRDVEYLGLSLTVPEAT